MPIYDAALFSNLSNSKCPRLRPLPVAERSSMWRAARLAAALARLAAYIRAGRAMAASGTANMTKA